MSEAEKASAVTHRGNKKSVFVTVGTTEFDKLIENMCTENVCKSLKDGGYTKMMLQIGRGTFEPPQELSGLHIEYFRYKPSIKENICQASLVISHAGAGSCLETLEAEKPLVVVINEELMDNHQLELANQLYKDGCIYYCDCRTLLKTLKEMDLSKLKKFTPGNPELFAKFLDNKMGFT